MFPETQRSSKAMSNCQRPSAGEFHNNYLQQYLLFLTKFPGRISELLLFVNLLSEFLLSFRILQHALPCLLGTKATLFSQCHTISQILLIRSKKQHCYTTPLVSSLQHKLQFRRKAKCQVHSITNYQEKQALQSDKISKHSKIQLSMRRVRILRKTEIT